MSGARNTNRVRVCRLISITMAVQLARAGVRHLAAQRRSALLALVECGIDGRIVGWNPPRNEIVLAQDAS